MPEFLTLLSPEDARAVLFSHLPPSQIESELVEVTSSLDRILAEDILAPHPLPEFERSTVDGYAVHAADTYGASDSLPSYLTLIGEVPMGKEPNFVIQRGQCASIHTGGMLPKDANAVVMLEYTQQIQADRREIEIFRAVADGENIIRIGEDVAQGQLVMARGSLIRPAEIGGLLALGITSIHVTRKICVGLISTGDEVVDPAQAPSLGQVRDINSYTLSALVEKYGGTAKRYGILPDQFDSLRAAAAKALVECDLLVITAGSSASARDMTADVIRSLGAPGVLVHGINTRPGKPTILGVCNGKVVIGLPGNPVSALVNAYLFVLPIIQIRSGALQRPKATLQARLTINLPSQAGREDWWPVKLIPSSRVTRTGEEGGVRAEPIFGKSNLIFTLTNADGLLRISPDATGLSAGELVEILLI